MRKADIYTAVIFILYSVIGFFYIIPTQIQYAIPPEEVTNAYVESLAYFGFLVSTPVFLAILVTAMGTRDWRYVVAMSILFPIVVNYFFWFAFKLALPEGSLFS